MLFTASVSGPEPGSRQRWVKRLHGPLVKRTRGHDINGFGWKDNQFPFRQRLHRPMDHVARVLGCRHIQDKRCHEKGGLWTKMPERSSFPPE